MCDSALRFNSRQLRLTLPNVISEELRARARAKPNGEVTWSPEDAAEVVRAIRRSGGRVLGLDLERYQPDGGYVEEPLYVCGGEASNEEAADWALKVLAEEAAAGDQVLVTWDASAPQTPA